MMEGIDYRGVPVAAALRIIPDSPWAIVARVDLSEVYAPQRAWLWMILVLMCALLAGAGLSILFYWRRLVDRFSREQLDAAELLRESEDKFSRAFQSAPYAITITDPQDGMFVDVNDAFYAITGFSRDEALGSSSISQDLWVNAEDCNHVVQELMSGRKVAGQEYRFKKKNGDVLTGLFSADIIELKTGKFILSSINDITKRITAQESLLVKNLVFDASIAANSIADLSGTITQSNDAFLRMWGYASRDEVVGRPLTDFIEHEEEASAIVTSLNTAGVWEGEYTARKRDASTFIAHGLATVVRDKKGTLIGYQSAVLDITESKRTEHELAKHREHLAELVEERTAEITKINIRLQEEIKERESANKELATFSYSVSHDLRAPLRAIDGFSKILEDEYGKLFDAEGLRLLAVVRKNTRNMGQLIDDLLAFSRLGRQEILYANIDMESLARSVSDELLATSAGRNMRITVGALPPANGDMPMIRQVFFNLLANAVKFTRTREPAVIEIGSMHEGGQHEYYVKDNGVGFDMHYVGKLFGVFQRLHNANEFEGTGVGLALTKSIIVKHGGSVRAEGHVNAGATFYFSLPIKGATDGSKPG
jgi:PAS domain S-box-containing protein